MAVVWALMLASGALTALGPAALGEEAFAAVALDEGLIGEEAQLWQAYEEGSLIRLHILAVDDTDEAQALKICVRDAILSAFGQQLAKEQDPEALFTWLSQNVGAMRRVAEETARSHGFTGDIKAEVGVLDLPAKRYGAICLPAGEYRGLRITLGQGQGQNWWCVLYPSLCLAVADDQPWRTRPQAEESIALPAADDSTSAASSDPPIVIWDTEKILAQWLAWPKTDQ